MPTYDYQCLKCEKEFTLILSMKDHEAKKGKCPKCGGKRLKQALTPFIAKTSRKS